MVFIESFLYFRSIVATSPIVILPPFGSGIGRSRKAKLSRFFHSIRKSYFLSPIAKFPIGWSRFDAVITDAIDARVRPKL